jgi:hypothetical protein
MESAALPNHAFDGSGLFTRPLALVSLVTAIASRAFLSDYNGDTQVALIGQLVRNNAQVSTDPPRCAGARRLITA